MVSFCCPRQVFTRSPPYSEEPFESVDDVKECVKDMGRRPDDAACASAAAAKAFRFTPVPLQELVRVSVWQMDWRNSCTGSPRLAFRCCSMC